MNDVINEEERHEAATEEPTTIGCQSLVPGKVVVHDEPADAAQLADVAPDYEMLARELTRDGFDVDRLAKAIEAEASQRPIEYPTFYTPGWLADLAKKMQSEKDREEARQKRKIGWKLYETKVDLCVIGKTQQNGKVYEVRISKRPPDVSDTYAQCKVNGKTVLTCSFIGGAWMLKRILTKGMQALVNYKAKKNRDSRRRDKRIADAAKQQAHDNKAKAGEVA